MTGQKKILIKSLILAGSVLFNDFSVSAQELLQQAPLEFNNPDSAMPEDPKPVRKTVKKSQQTQTQATTTQRTMKKTVTQMSNTAGPAPVRKAVVAAPVVETEASPEPQPSYQQEPQSQRRFEEPMAQDTNDQENYPTTDLFTGPSSSDSLIERRHKRKLEALEAKKDSWRNKPVRGAGRKKAMKNYRAGFIYATRDGTSDASLMFSWDPVVKPWQRYNVGFTLGATSFKSESLPLRQGRQFLVVEYGLAISYYSSRTFLPEMVIGAQTWNDGGLSHNPLIAFNANFLYRRRPYKVVDRLYVGLAGLQMDGGYTYLIRGGVGFHF